MAGLIVVLGVMSGCAVQGIEDLKGGGDIVNGGHTGPVETTASVADIPESGRAAVAGQRREVSAQTSVEKVDHLTMTQESELVVTVSGPLIKTGRTVSFPAPRVQMMPDGSEVHETVEAPVYEATVESVPKQGTDTLDTGDRILVVPSVDRHSEPPMSQASRLESTRRMTLYLEDVVEQGGVIVSDPGQSETEDGQTRDLWVTYLPVQGVEFR